MSDICSKHGPYSVLCKMCDFETPTPPQGDARVTVLRELLDEAKNFIGAKNDTLSPAQREANINHAWHLLNGALVFAPVEPEARAQISPNVRVLTIQELEEIKHASYREARENAIKDFQEENPHAGCFCPYCNPPPSAAPQTHSTDDEARTVANRLQDAKLRFFSPGHCPDMDPLEFVRVIDEAADLLSRIPSEEATEEDAFKTCDAIEAVMSKWQSVPSNGGYVVSQFSQAGLRITRTPKETPR